MGSLLIDELIHLDIIFGKSTESLLDILIIGVFPVRNTQRKS